MFGPHRLGRRGGYARQVPRRGAAVQAFRLGQRGNADGGQGSIRHRRRRLLSVAEFNHEDCPPSPKRGSSFDGQSADAAATLARVKCRDSLQAE